MLRLELYIVQSLSLNKLEYQVRLKQGSDK